MWVLLALRFIRLRNYLFALVFRTNSAKGLKILSKRELINRSLYMFATNIAALSLLDVACVLSVQLLAGTALHPYDAQQGNPISFFSCLYF
jgi:hypothetical protein